jgi:hypothetical protein
VPDSVWRCGACAPNVQGQGIGRVRPGRRQVWVPLFMKPLRTILVGACAAGLLVTSLAASAVSSAQPTATAATQYKSSVRFLDFDRTRAYGSTTHVRGQIVVPSRGEAIRDLRVKLYRQFDGRSHWSYLGRGTTSHGRYAEFRFSVRSRANASYRIVFAGNRSLRGTDGSTAVNVHRVFDVTLEDGSGRFHGQISPHYADHRVYLDRRHCGSCNWHRLKTGHTDSRAHFSFHTDAPRHGKFYWRVATPATTKYIHSYSSVFTTQLQ